MYRKTKQYPSAAERGCNTSKTQTQTYTGTLVTGIALLHKQAYTPVTAPIKTDPKRQ